MNSSQYTALLEKLGLNILSCGRMLGVSRRQTQRYAAGANIPPTVAKLLLLMERHGIAPAEVEGLE
jgi:hypothetical protein